MPSTQPYLPTLYKARRVPTKQAVCAICAERTRGRTRELNMGYGVSVWLCAGHASREFQTQRGGRDLVLTLQRLWRAHGCLSAARHKALRAHLAALAGPKRPPPARQLLLADAARRGGAPLRRGRATACRDRRPPRPPRGRHGPGSQRAHNAALVCRAALARPAALAVFDTIRLI